MLIGVILRLSVPVIERVGSTRRMFLKQLICCYNNIQVYASSYNKYNTSSWMNQNTSLNSLFSKFIWKASSFAVLKYFCESRIFYKTYLSEIYLSGVRSGK